MRIAAALVLALLGAAAAAADAPLPAGEVLMRVRTEVAQLLGKKPADVDVAKPLAAQGADELDIVEIVMALEEEFGISIPDDAIESDGMGWNVLTVQRLAQIVQNLKRGAPPQP